MKEPGRGEIGSSARAELPPDLRPGFELHARATAHPDTSRLRLRLEAAGFFLPDRTRVPFRLFRIAGLFLLGALTLLTLLGAVPRRSIYAMVRETRGELYLERGGRRFQTRNLRTIQDGDLLQAGREGCRLVLADGALLEISPRGRVRCRRFGKPGCLLLELGRSGARIESGERPFTFRAEGQCFTTEGACSIRRGGGCSKQEPHNLGITVHRGTLSHRPSEDEDTVIRYSCEDPSKPPRFWIGDCGDCRARLRKPPEKR